MSKTIAAVYENGVLRPLEPLSLRERQLVTVTVEEGPIAPVDEEWLDTEYLQIRASEADDSISLDAARKLLSNIPGSMTADFISERDER